MKTAIFLIYFNLFAVILCFAQAGMTSSPARLYYRLPPGASGSQKVMVSNPNAADLEIGISLGDWDYDSLGNNRLFEPEALKTSCASWIKVLPGSYFTLLPNEDKELFVVLNVPADANTNIPVHTAMLYLTQMNPGNMSAANGAALKVSVRMGVKVYHSFTSEDDRNIEINDFKDRIDTVKTTPASKPLMVSLLELNLENTGKIWLEGKISWELINQGTGEKIKLKDQDFLSLPGDKRIVRKELPGDLKKGRYSAAALINYGNKDQLKLVELEFEH